jgi:hypothetical protein
MKIFGYAPKTYKNGVAVAQGITKEHTQEGLSRAYVSAVAFSAGVNLELGKCEFDYGVDGYFKKVALIKKTIHNTGCNLEFQMKCSYAWRLDGSNISYPLKVGSYNSLVARMAEYRNDVPVTPKILILMCLPDSDPDSWLTLDENTLALKKCCYFHTVEGPVSNADKHSTKTIKIPKTNLLTPASILDLLERVKERRL